MTKLQVIDRLAMVADMLDEMGYPECARACREAVDMINHQPERLARRDILEDAGFEY